MKRFTDEQIAEGVRGFVDETIKEITRNLSIMRDSKGRNRYASGKTAAGIGAANPKRDWVSVSKRGGLIIRIYMPPQWKYINYGVKGAESVKPKTGASPYQFKNKRPPLSVIREFMMNRGIVPRRGGQRIDKGAGGEKARNRLAWVIAESIRKKGIEAFPFFDNAVTLDKIQDLEKQLLDLYEGKFIEDIVVDFNE